MRFTSKNSTIASVSNTGLVTGLRAGTTSIEVRDDSNNFLGEIPTEVKDSAEYVPTNGISLSDTSVSLKYAYGNSKQITATVTPANATNKTVQWVSANPAALSCVNGYLKCLKNGSGEVRVTANAADGQSAFCIVSIVENGSTVNSVTPSTINVGAEGGTFDIAVSVTNRDGYYSGYKVYAANEGEYGTAFSVSEKKENGFKLTVKKNTGEARSFVVNVMGIDADSYCPIIINQAYSRVESGFAYSSMHRVYDEKNGKVSEEMEVDTTYFLANQDPHQGPTGYRHVWDEKGFLISGSAIIYIDCAASAFEEIYQKTKTTKSWLSLRSYHEYRSDLGGLIGIEAATNDTGVKRDAFVVFPGGHSYPVIQDA